MTLTMMAAIAAVSGMLGGVPAPRHGAPVPQAALMQAGPSVKGALPADMIILIGGSRCCCCGQAH